TEQVEPVFNTVAGVRRTALVGVGALGQQVPVLCYELLPEQHFQQVETQLQALALQHPELGGIEHFLRHPGFPVDIRHNAKIGREKLAVWAQAQLG
ncbi:MAG: peptide synthase, partial [Stenotrophomonas sp.]